MRKSLEAGALRRLRVVKEDWTGAASACFYQRASMVAVRKLLYNDYKVVNEVVFQNTPTRAPALTEMAGDCRTRNPMFDPFKNCQNCKVWRGWTPQCVWCCTALIYSINCADITPHITQFDYL
jgi:hypothetical protein